MYLLFLVQLSQALGLSLFITPAKLAIGGVSGIAVIFVPYIQYKCRFINIYIIGPPLHCWCENIWSTLMGMPH